MKVTFFFYSKTYQIELTIFNKHSTFFSDENKINKAKGNIDILSEFDICKVHTEESIIEFLEYCQDKPINLQVSNISSIQALSKQFLVTQLQKDAEEFSEKHYKEVIDYVLSSKGAITPMIEKLITAHFIEYWNDDRLFQLPISSLYRIHQHFLSQIKDDGETKSDQIKIQNRTIIDFLIKAVSILGHESSILITSNKFNQEQIQYLDEKMFNIEDENTLELLTEFLQSNANYIVEYQKNEKMLKEEETKKYDKIMETLIKEQENQKQANENELKRINDEIKLLQYNYDNLK